MATGIDAGGTWNTTAGNKTVVATPAANDLIVVVHGMSGWASGDNSTITDNNSDGNGTYTKFGTATTPLSNGGGTACALWFSVRNSLIGSGTSTTFTATNSGDTGGGLTVLRFSGMTRTGALAVLQSIGQSTQTENPPSIDFSSATKTNNPIILAVMGEDNPPALTSPAGFTEADDTGWATPTTGVQVCWDDGGNTSSSYAWTAGALTDHNEIAIELDTTSPISGSTDGTCTVGGVLTGKGSMATSTDCTSTIAGILAGIGSLSGSITCTSTVEGSMIAAGLIAAVLNCDSTTDGTLAGFGNLQSTENCSSSVTGTLAGIGNLSAVENCTSSVSGMLASAVDISGSSEGTSVVSGTLTSTVNAVGQIDGTSTVNGILTGEGLLQASDNGVSSVSGIISGIGSLVSIDAGTSTVNGILIGAGSLTASENCTSTIEGILNGIGSLVGVINGDCTVTGTLSEAGNNFMIGLSEGNSSVSGTITGIGSLLSEINNTSSVDGILSGIGQLSGLSEGTSTVTGTLTIVSGAISGSTFGSCTVSGTISYRSKQIISFKSKVSSQTGFSRVRSAEYRSIISSSLLKSTIDE